MEQQRTHFISTACLCSTESSIYFCGFAVYFVLNCQIYTMLEL